MHSKETVTRAIAKGPCSKQGDRSTVYYFDKSGFEGWLLAVMDDHHSRGAVAEFCKRKIEDLFVRSLSDANCVKGVHQKVVAELNTQTKHYNNGTTLSIACVLESHDTVTPAILGDSPVIVIDEDGKVHVGPVHNVRTNLKERRAARRRGGEYKDDYIWNPATGYGLQVSRALGDAKMGKIISHKPEIYTIERPKLVLAATDGFLDLGSRGSKKQIEEVVEIMLSGGEAQDLMDWAENRESGLEDNATVILWRSKNSS